MPRSTKSIPDALKNWDAYPDDAFVRLPVVQALFACSPATVWRGVRQGRIPKPVKLSARTTGWKVGGLRLALAAVGSSQ